jgi:putative flippase GtrA
VGELLHGLAKRLELVVEPEVGHLSSPPPCSAGWEPVGVALSSHDTQVRFAGAKLGDDSGRERPVRALLALYYRLSSLVRELLKFGAVGGVAFVVDVSLFNLMLHLTDKPLTSKTVSTITATTVAYVGNRHWTFRKRSRSGVRREYALFFVLNAVGLAIALTCLFISHYVLGFTSRLADNIAANGVGLALGTAFRFWSYRRWVFPELLPEAAAPLRER